MRSAAFLSGEARQDPDELFIEHVARGHQEHGDHDGAARHEDDVDGIARDQGEDRRQHRFPHDDLLHIPARIGGGGLLYRLADADQAFEGGPEAGDLAQELALQAGRVLDPLHAARPRRRRPRWR